jgi:hypothetical protein
MQAALEFTTRHPSTLIATGAFRGVDSRKERPKVSSKLRNGKGLLTMDSEQQDEMV